MKPHPQDGLLYRSCVGIALFNNEGKVFVGERIDSSGAWQMPQGGMDEGEDVHKTALRELAEEIGTDKAEILMTAENRLRYDLPDSMIPKLWSGKYKGQEQTWVAARFTGKDADINLSAHTPPEFKNWQWVRLQDTIDLIVPFKRDTYRQVIEFFQHIPSQLR